MDNSEYKIVQTSSGKACYEIAGEGMPMLVIHGSGGGTEQGHLIAQRLLPDGKAVCPARFSYQDSDLPKQPDAIKQAAAYLDILQTEMIEKAHVVAFSAGGPSAVQFASLYPEHCLSLTLISAVQSPSLRKGLKAKLAFSQLRDPDMIYGLLTLLSRKSRRLSFLGASREIRRRLEKEDEHFLDLVLRSLRHPQSHLKGALSDRDLKPLLDSVYRTITCPTLLIHSQDDKVVPIDNADFALSLIPQAEIFILPEGGHLLFTQHSKIKERITAFWKTITVDA